MSRGRVITAFAVSLLLVTGAMIAYLSYGVRTAPPKRAILPGLTAPVRIAWSKEGPVAVEADSNDDFAAALGYAHGMNRTWFALLLRQAALGRLSEWFGPRARPEDRLARRLSLARAAKDRFDRLAPEEKHPLEQYAAGMNAALSSDRVRNRAELVLLDVIPEPWEPWHSMAVERLWAWIGSPAQNLPDSLDGVPAFKDDDRAVRTRLHLFGTQENMALLVGFPNRPRILFRFITGDTALPFFQEFVFNRNGVVSAGLSVPGTLIFPAGRTNGTAWIYLLTSDVSASAEAAATLEAPTVRFDRLEYDDSDEEVIAVERIAGALPLSGKDGADSLVTLLHWTGLDDTAGHTPWTKLLEGGEPGMEVFRADGMFIGGPDGPRVSGTPATVHAGDPNVLFISNSSQGEALLNRVRDIVAGRTRVQSEWDLLHDTFRESVTAWTGDLILSLDSIDVRTVREDDAVAYLRNWDFSYRGASIAASIAEHVRDRLPKDLGDGLSLDSIRSALDGAIDYLTANFGTDMREWRWETVLDLHIYYPGWTGRTQEARRTVRQFGDEFGPVRVPGRGHPATLAWGPGVSSAWRQAPSAWEGFYSTRPSQAFEIERPHVSYSSFLGRFLATSRAPVRVAPPEEESPNSVTKLLPLR